jgi:glutathione peroxidase-family protein
VAYHDALRQRYVQEHHIEYPVVHWTRESDPAYGGISIFPTLFLIDRKGMVRAHWIGDTQPDDLRRVITDLLKEN